MLLLLGTLMIVSILHNSFSDNISKKRFPENFKFGVATSAYQIEGAWDENGKGENIWDHFTHTNEDFIKNGTIADVACDSFHKLREDVAILKELGVNYYKFSISWTRLLPKGTPDDVSETGLKYYKDLISELKKLEIEPLVTLMHWDLPQVFQDKGGFMNEDISSWVTDYAGICFDNFGEDVKMWITFDNPQEFCNAGYGYGTYAPGVKSEANADYICGYNVMMTHANIWIFYMHEYKHIQKGRVSIALGANWYEPASNSTEDKNAAETALEFDLGWFAHPLYQGGYPQIMKTRIGNRSQAEGMEQSRLPPIISWKIEFILLANDFFTINFYGTKLAKAISEPEITKVPTRRGDVGVDTYVDSTWEVNSLGWGVVPSSIRKLLKHIKDKYNNPEIIITGNGFSDKGGLQDEARINYIKNHLSYVRDAMDIDNVNVTGYFIWSAMDNFQWTNGYEHKFGIYDVDFNSDNRTRTQKKSGEYYAKVIKTRCLVDTCED